MNRSRRNFLQIAVSAGATASLFDASGTLFAQTTAQRTAEAKPTDRTVTFVGDSLVVSPEQRVQELARLLAKNDKASDTYLSGGAVADLERRFAEMLGKEDAVFMATGTLANNIAVRVLCGEHRHAIVQHESHLYRDEADSASTLGGINLVPLARGRACPTYDEVAEAIDDAEHGPYPIAVGAISLESPVRRADGASVPYALAERISSLARSKKIGMHLDGARLLLMAGTPDFDLRRYSTLFDTVYISLYKYLGAPFGAILAGTREQMAKARELRHVYGGLIYHGWQAALPSLDALPGFMQRFTEARRAADALFGGLQRSGQFQIERVENGSNIVIAHVLSEHAAKLQQQLAKADIRIRPVTDGKVPLMFNETILRRSTEELLAAFVGRT